MLMRAFRIFEWGKGGRLVDTAIPEPGPGQVRLKVAANGICHSDLYLLKEWKASPPHLKIELPMTIGHEPAGWVDKLGPGVEGFEQGEPMIVTIAGCGKCYYCAIGRNQYCLHKGKQVGMGLDGANAEYMLAPAAALVNADGMDLAEAAPLTDAGLTSYHAIKRVESLLVPGSRVAVIGIGGLGHMALQILKATTNAHIIAYARSRKSLDFALELGADEARDSTKPESFEPFDVDVVLDFVGSAVTIGQAAKMIRPLGHNVVVGRGGGTFEFRHNSMPYGATMSTTFGGSKFELMELVELARAGKVKAHITRFALDDVAEAYALLEAGKIQGRGVIVP
jgi:propanol-preferring alcohol dehydrogenase